ncbi:MAG: hypothetical protein RL616_864 [Verrucomicrobiota bacterium]|jgi:hypothetical protein
MTLSENSAPARPPKLYCWLLGLLVVACVALRAALSATTDFSVGDAFITFRFAEQFAAGHGLVFNAGEWVGGNTSVLHSLLLGLGACTGASVPLVAHIEGIVFDMGALFFLWNILRGPAGLRSPGLQLFVLAVIFLCPLLFWYSVSGLETPLYLLLIFFLFDRTLKRVDWQWFLAVALLFFCRPDGIIAVIAALACLLFTHKKIPWAALFGTFFIGLAYLGYNYFLYHTAIPPTVKVKGLVYHCTVWDNVGYLAGRFFFRRSWLLFVFLGIVLAAMAGRWRMPAVRLLGIATFGYLFFLLFAPTLRSWYCAPFLALGLGTILFALGGAVEKFNFRRLNVYLTGLLAVYLAVSFLGDKMLFKECGTWRERIRGSTEAQGEWFKANTPPDARLLVECAEVGWFSKRHIADWPGLVSPQVLALVKANPKIGFFEIANHLRPDYVIIHQGWNAVDDTNVPPNFECVATFHTADSGAGMGMTGGTDLIYRRKGD